MRDLLVRYLLSEVSDDQRRSIERRLESEPALRQQLEQLRRCMGLEGDDAPCDEPPEGLAERTAERVVEAAESGEYQLPSSAGVSSLGFVNGGAGDGDATSSASWSVTDMVVAAGAMMAVGMLLLPALSESRCASRRLECQNNMRQLGVALLSYSDQNNGYYPLVHRGENAGIFAVRLVSSGYVDQKQMAGLLVCPSSKLAQQIRDGEVRVHVPTFSQLRDMPCQQLAALRRLMGGSYAYRLGYVEGDEYIGIRNDFRALSPVLADAPEIQDADYRSRNHGGCGQNVLFQSGHVRYLKGFLASDGQDHLFLNAIGQVAAGRHRRDTVLVPSEATPGILPAGGAR